MNIDDHVTVDEQIKIVKRARSLISEPCSWVQGSWKCQVFTRKDGEAVPAVTPNGTQQYQYCVEGAINQATYDVLGEQRALELGAVRFSPDTGLIDFQGDEENLGYDPTKLLGIDAISRELYGVDAMEYNDCESEWEGAEEHTLTVHTNIVNLLSRKLADLGRRKEKVA